MLDNTVVIKVPKPLAIPSPKPKGPLTNPFLGASIICKKPSAIDDAYPVGLPIISKFPTILNKP